MKKIFAIVACSIIATGAAAETVSEKTYACLTQRYLEKYLSHLQNNEEAFAKIMIDRVQCVPMLPGTQLAPLAEVGDFVEVETLEGFKLWMQKKFLVKAE